MLYPILQRVVETLLEPSTHIQLKEPLDEKSRKSILASLKEMLTEDLGCLGSGYKEEDLSGFATYCENRKTSCS